jgi:redox-sensitive bicupin YhaK (pirin superfamily)
VIEGDVSVNGQEMTTGSAAQIRDEPRVGVVAASTAELILVDVAI